MSLAVRILGYAVTGLALLVGLAVVISLLIGVGLWIDDLIYQARVRRDCRLSDEADAAILAELLGDHGHGPN